MLIGDANGCIWVYPNGLQQTGSPPPPTSNVFASVHGNRLWAAGVQGTNWTITWSHLQSHIWFADKVIYKTCKRATGRAEDCCSSQNPWAKVVQMRLLRASELSTHHQSFITSAFLLTKSFLYFPEDCSYVRRSH